MFRVWIKKNGNIDRLPCHRLEMVNGKVRIIEKNGEMTIFAVADIELIIEYGRDTDKEG